MSSMFKDFINIFLYWIQGIVYFFIPRKLRFKDISKDIVLVTGSGSGIGRLTAIKLSNLVTTIVLLDVNEAGLIETAEKIKNAGGKCHYYVCDLSDRKAIYSTIENIKHDIGNVSIVINNAGIVTGKPLIDLTDEEILRTFEVNALSHFWINRSLLPDMMKNNRGHFVCVSSLAGIIGSAKLTDYCASKAATALFHESMYLELQKLGYSGINVTLIMPYLVDTGLFEGAKDNVIRRLKPEEVANKIVEAILTNQLVVFMPKLFYSAMIFKSLLPIKSSVSLYKLLGGEQFMDNFMGRNNNRTVKKKIM